MRRPSVDDMLNNKITRYALVIAVAREIAAEFEKENIITDEKPVMLAIEEFKQHKYNILEPEVDD